MNKIPKVGEILPKEDLKGIRLADGCHIVDVQHSPKTRYFTHKNGESKYATGFELIFKSARVYADEDGRVTGILNLGKREAIIVGFGGWESFGLIDTYDGSTQKIGGDNFGCSYEDFKEAIRKWCNPTEDSWDEMKEQSDKAGFYWWEEE